MLRGPLDYSLEFRYCFLTRISGISQESQPESTLAENSGGPSLPF